MSRAPSNEAFLIAAFRACTASESPWVAGIDGDPGTADPRHWAGRPILRGIPGFIRPANNNYVCVSTFWPDADGGWHRRKANFAAMHAVMVDDVGTKVPRDRLVLEPSVMVETSPDNFQAWYFLDPPETDPVRADLLVKRMISAGLSADAKDPGMRGVTRYGRLPVGCNAKAAYVERLGAPFVQQVACWHLERYVSLDDIANAYKLDLSPEPVKLFRGRPASASADSLVQKISHCGLYLESMSGIPGAHRIICPWVHEHTGRDESGTVYFEPTGLNGWHGGFKCHHGHCISRGIKDLQRFMRAIERINKKRNAA